MKKTATVLWQHATIVLLCIGMIATTACTPQEKLAVVTDIQKFTPVIINLAEAVCAFTPAAPICVAGGAAVGASANILETALVNYYKAQAQGAVAPGIVAALQQAISVFEGDASNILEAVHVVDSVHQAQIIGLAAAASVLLGLIESLLPAGIQTNGKFKASAPAAGQFDLNKWVGDYNATVESTQKSLPRNVKLKKVHVHSATARYLTVGILK